MPLGQVIDWIHFTCQEQEGVQPSAVADTGSPVTHRPGGAGLPGSEAPTPTPARPRRAAAEAAMARTAAVGAELIGSTSSRRSYPTGNIAQVPPEMFAQMEEMFRESGDK